MTTTLPSGSGRSAVAGESGHRWMLLVTVAVAQLMVVLDGSIVNVALPSAQRDLGFADTDRQWIITAYTLAFGGLLLVGGTVGDRIGRRTAFIAGALGFAAASVIGGAAPSLGVLLASRALQGVFAALLAPAALATLATTFTRGRERSIAFTVFSVTAGAGAAVGLLLGGPLTEFLSWRYCLWVNVVFAALAAAGAARSFQPGQRRHDPLDPAGTAFVVIGCFALVFGCSTASTAGWFDPVTMTSLVLSVFLLVGFVLIERRVPHPLLPLPVVLDRLRGASYLAVGICSLAVMGVFLFLTYDLQQVQGFSPVLTGLAFLPLTASIVTATTTSNMVLLNRLGPKPLIVTGMLFGTAAMLDLARLSTASSYGTDIVPAIVLLGLGFGLVLAPTISCATVGVQKEEAGIASAMVNVAQQLGGTIGIAVLSTVAFAATNARSSTSGTALAASVHGYDVAFVVSAGVFVAGAICAALLLPAWSRPAAEGVTHTTA